MEDLLNNHKQIRFIGDVASHKNGAADNAIKKVVTTERTMLMHDALRRTKEELSNDIWPMEMGYSIWTYNRIPDMKSGLSAINIWSRLRFDSVSETLSIFHLWGCPKNVLEPKLQKPGVKCSKWYIRSLIGFITGFNKKHSTLVWLVLILVAGSMSLLYHVVFDYIFLLW